MATVLINGVEKKLTAKEENFCQAYLLHFNASRAMREAGYNPTTEDSAGAMGHQILYRPHVQARIAELRKDAADRLSATKERILLEYARIAFADIRKAFDADGKLKNISEMDEDTAAAIGGIETDEIFDFIDGMKSNIGLTRKVKMWNKADGLAGLAKILGYNAPEKFEGTISGAVVKIGGKQISDE